MRYSVSYYDPKVYLTGTAHMQLYEVKYPDVDTYIQFKILNPTDAELLAKSQTSLSKDRYSKAVLESVINNLTDILEQLRPLPKDKAAQIINALYNGAVMLNPGIDVDAWLQLGMRTSEIVPATTEKPARKAPVKKRATAPKKISKAKFLNLEQHLKSKIIGQDEAISEVVNALKRSMTGLSDPRRPVGVFLFAGASGVGKTHLARELHKYLYGEDYDLVRIDCGEFQHKHENSKLIGAPPGYLGYDEGGQLTNQLAKHPNTVLLLDEVEKAHPDLWHTFLRVFDEGVMTDGSGKKISFRETVIIMTTNLGNKEVVEEMIGRSVGFGARGEVPNKNRRERIAHEAIRKNFTPELLNRIDKVVIFNRLTNEDYEHIAELELMETDNKLLKRGFSLQFDEAVLQKMASTCVDSVGNARRLAQIRRDDIENRLAELILRGTYRRGTVFSLTVKEDDFFISAITKTKSLDGGTKIECS